MKSGVIGSRPTVPRMPSVPKYLRVMRLLPERRRLPAIASLVAGARTAVHGSLWSRASPTPSGCRGHRPSPRHRARARCVPPLYGQQHGGQARRQAIVDVAPGHRAERRLARPSHQQWIGHVGQRSLAPQEFQVVLDRLPESDARVDHEPIARRCRRLRAPGHGRRGIHEPPRRRPHTGVRVAWCRARPACASGRCRPTAAEPVTRRLLARQRAHIVDDVGAGIQDRLHHHRRAGVHRDRDAQGAGMSDHRQHTGEFLVDRPAWWRRGASTRLRCRGCRRPRAPGFRSVEAPRRGSRPPSKNESGVTFTMPITRGRSSSRTKRPARHASGAFAMRDGAEAPSEGRPTELRRWPARHRASPRARRRWTRAGPR